MSKSKTDTITVQGTDIVVLDKQGKEYICITGIARHQNPKEPEDVVKNWMRNRGTIEFLALWEKIHNPSFKGVEIDPLLFEAGSNSFTMSPTKWVETTNAIMESINALLIRQGLSQRDRLIQLNNTAITQMKSLLAGTTMRRLK